MKYVKPLHVFTLSEVGEKAIGALIEALAKNFGIGFWTVSNDGQTEIWTSSEHSVSGNRATRFVEGWLASRKFYLSVLFEERREL